MRVVDLTQRIAPGEATVYPGDPEPQIVPHTSHERDGYYANILRLYEHTGTHVDAPAHMIPGGLTIDRVPAERLAGPAILLDASGLEEIGPGTVSWAVEALAGRGFLLLHTGYKGEGEHPVLTEEAAMLIAGHGIKGVGLDAPSPDRPPYKVHRILLASGTLIIENLSGLLELLGDRKSIVIPLLVVAPLPVAGGSGAPARVLAIL